MFSHWHKDEIILLVLFYTLWDTFKYFIHDFFSWGSQVTNLEQSVIRVFLAGGTYTIINQLSLALTVFLLNTCKQTQTLSSDDADCYQESTCMDNISLIVSDIVEPVRLQHFKLVES